MDSLSRKMIDDWLAQTHRDDARSHETGDGQHAEHGMGRSSVKLWGAPHCRYDYELDVDASHAQGRTGVAAILWTPSGGVVESWSARLDSNRSTCEIAAVLWAVRKYIASDLDGSLRLWADCSSSLAHFNKHTHSRRALIRLQHRFSALKIQWVPRWCIPEVDMLAVAARCGHTLECSGNFPSIDLKHRKAATAGKARHS